MSFQPPDLDRQMPQWATLARVAPVSAWSVGLVALGFWARGLVDREFIEFLRDACKVAP